MKKIEKIKKLIIKTRRDGGPKDLLFSIRINTVAFTISSNLQTLYAPKKDEVVREKGHCYLLFRD